jgi:hypothetical protein
VSRETSYVAIERREVPVTGEVQLRRVPVALTHGWADVQQPRLAHARAWPTSVGIQSAIARPASVAAAKLAPARFMDFASSAGDALSDALQAPRVKGQPGAARRPRSTHAGDALRARVLALVQLQRADGSWAPGDEFFRAVGVEEARFRRALDDVTSMLALEPSTAHAVALATAVAIAWLETHAGGVSDEWRLVGDKARDALTALVGGKALAAWLDAARSVPESTALNQGGSTTFRE